MTTEKHDDGKLNASHARRPKDERMSELEEAEAAAWLTEGMRGFDDVFEPRVPDAAQLEQLVRAAKQEAQRKLWRELALLWTIGCVILGGLNFLLAEEPTAFLAVQGAGTAAGVLWLVISALRNPGGRWKGSWTE